MLKNSIKVKILTKNVYKQYWEIIFAKIVGQVQSSGEKGWNTLKVYKKCLRTVWERNNRGIHNFG